MSSTVTPHARHSARDSRRNLGRRAGIAVLAVVLFLVSGACIALWDLQHQVNRVDVSSMLGTDRPTRAATADSYKGQAVNILVLGSDSRQGDNDVDGSAETETVARSDTAMVMHVSADRKRIDIVSIPRDTLVEVPDCTSSDGSTVSGSDSEMFNQAFANGAGTDDDENAIAAGAACTIKTVETLTGVYIDEYMVVDFDGLSNMIDALGGVKVYVTEDIDDADYTGLVLKKGCYLMDGATALKYARVRHGVGDGSDIQRIARQQNLMSAMLRTAKEKNLLTNADDLYSFAKSALASLTTSPGIGSLSTLAGLAQSIQDIGMDKVNFVTMPNEAPDWNPNRVVPTDEADEVWAALKADKAVPAQTVSVAADGSTPSAQATPSASAEDAQTAEAAATTAAPAAASTTKATEDPAAQCH
ncbi:LCP family protein [Actinomyces radicidentis]|uniref:LCP family protein n=1 Tax=Actinomyces radicidentis TaxID=111015 RepID=UPI0026DF2868|nr:LCP family protein [Actinomyces radicidentis]